MPEERRLVTVLFADVSGSTALGESADPEDLRALLARFYAIARDVVPAHGGTLEKFIGDAVMAVFGLPQAHGDDAERALAAALELRDRVRAEPALGPRLPIRLGLSTGEVVAARDQSAGDFLVTGDVVNVAARLQQAAEPWAILVGERTARAAGTAFIFGPAIDVQAKGKAAPLRALPLANRAPARALHRVPLFGRDRDLAHLELLVRRTVEERRPYVVSIIAPAGTGKTRLVEELLDRLPRIAPGATVAIAQCLPYGQRLTYWPMRAVLFRLAGIQEDASPDAARAGIHSWLREIGVESRAVAEHLAATIGIGEVDTSDRDALFAAWRTSVEAASRHHPVVLVFEDLHWSSDTLLDLVEFVTHPRADSVVLMIALARPELLDRRPSWGAGRRNYVSLALESLSDDAVSRLVKYLLGAPSGEIVQRVVTRVEGNPFYAGEIVRSIVERVASIQDQAAVEQVLAGLPDTVQATVLARLDLLGEPERRVLQLGAIFGRSFSAPGIGALAPELAQDVGTLAEALIDKDLIRSSDTDRFSFRHILIRDVAYQTLPRGERAHLHAAAGRWMEERAEGREDALAELIAYHFREAASLSGGTAPGSEEQAVRAKAVQWLSRAADVATSGAAFREAARHFQAAIDFALPDELPELYERLGDTGGGDAAVDAYSTSLRLCRVAGRSPDQQIRVLASLLTVYMRFQASVGNRPPFEHIQNLRKEGRTLAESAHDERAVASLLVAEAFIPFWKGADATREDIEEADRSVRRALAIAERLDDPRLLSAALDGVGSVAQARGDWEGAIRAGRKRLMFQDRLDLPERLDAYGVVAWASAIVGDLHEADRVTAAGLSTVLPGQGHAWTLHVAAWRAYTLMLLGRWDEAVAAGERARELWIEAGRGPTGYGIHGFIAVLDVARGRRDSALADRFREVLSEILRPFPIESAFGRMRSYVPFDLDALEADVVRGFGSMPMSRMQFVERALALCTDLGRVLPEETLRAIVEHSVAHRAQVLEAQARRALGRAVRDPVEVSRALEVFERIGAAPFAARARCERALLTGDRDDLAAGTRLLEELGDIDQLERIAQASPDLKS